MVREIASDTTIVFVILVTWVTIAIHTNVTTFSKMIKQCVAVMVHVFLLIIVSVVLATQDTIVLNTLAMVLTITMNRFVVVMVFVYLPITASVIQGDCSRTAREPLVLDNLTTRHPCVLQMDDVLRKTIATVIQDLEENNVLLLHVLESYLLIHLFAANMVSVPDPTLATVTLVTLGLIAVTLPATIGIDMMLMYVGVMVDAPISIIALVDLGINTILIAIEPNAIPFSLMSLKYVQEMDHVLDQMNVHVIQDMEELNVINIHVME